MKITSCIAIALLSLITTLSATSVAPISFKELVERSDYIFAAEVVGVRMTNGKGKAITDPEARTGPGLDNTIWLDVVVDHSLILKSRDTKIPGKIAIPLWQMWHHTLGQIKEVDHNKAFFLLDKDFKPAYPASFQISLDEQKELESLIRKQKAN